MYVCKKKNREGTEYAFLIEGYRLNGKSRQRTLKYFGKVSDEEFQELKEKNVRGEFAELARTNKIIKVNLDMNKGNDSNTPLNIGYKLLEKVYNSLEIDEILKQYSKDKKFQYDLNVILKLLVFGRIQNPLSKFATVKDFQKSLFGNWDVSQNDMDRALDNFDEIKEDVQFIVNQSITKNIGRSATLVFYDVTNYYFETDIDDPCTYQLDDEEKIVNDKKGKPVVVKEGFRRRGASKEKRPNPIVQMGLFMDSNAIPIAYKIFRGNQTDPITYLPAIEQVKKQFGIERIVTVADKAMNSANNIKETLAKDDGYLFSQKFRGVKGSPVDVQEFVLSEDGWEYNTDFSFAKKSMIRERILVKATENKEAVTTKEKVLVTWREKYARREKIRREGALNYANGLRNPEKYRQTMRKGGKKYLKATLIDVETGEKVLAHPYLDIDQDLVDFDAQFDGMNVIVTSETTMSDEDMIEHYGELVQIEDCFRVTKTELRARPIYVWTKEHIEAHFLTCFLALVIIRLIQNKLDWQYSPRRIINAINSLNISDRSNGIVELFKNEDAYEILKNYDKNIWKQYYKVEELDKIMN